MQGGCSLTFGWPITASGVPSPCSVGTHPRRCVPRKGYLRQNARGKLPDENLDAMLAEVDEQREAIRAELRAVEDEAEVLRRRAYRRYGAASRWTRRATLRSN